MRPSPYLSTSQPGARSARKATQMTKGAVDFLSGHDKMASLLPAVTRMAALQSDCAASLPPVFAACAVLQFSAGQLVLSVPNAAVAAKLKQQLPKLQENLAQRGWQVNAIRLKVQVTNIAEKLHKNKQLVLPSRAISSLASLGEALEDSPRNDALKAAIRAMVERHQMR
jgi:hypothetical protein